MLNFEVSNQRENLIILIHGLFGGKKTWHNKSWFGKKKATILNSLQNDREVTQYYDIALHRYDTALPWYFRILSGRFTIWIWRKNLPFQKLGRILESEINEQCRPYKKIILIGHSMGGLVAKSCIIDTIKNQKHSKIIRFFSLAVPHKGSDLAHISKIFMHAQVRTLIPSSPEIDELTEQWLLITNIPKTKYFKGENDRIVTGKSAIGFENSIAEVVYTDDTHSSILHIKESNRAVIDGIKNELRVALHEPAPLPPVIVNTGLSEKQRQLLRDGALLKRKEYRNALLNRINQQLETYGDFFERKISDSIGGIYDFQNFAEKILSNNYSNIWGDGGLGKSTVLKRIALYELNRNVDSVTVICDAKDWNDGYSSGLDKDNSFDSRVAYLCTGMQSSIPFENFEEYDIQQFQQPFQKYLFVDGLNEIPNEQSRREISDLLNEMSRRYSFHVIATKRYANKNEDKAALQYKLMNISDEDLENLTVQHFGKKLSQYEKRNLEYLSIPYFLNIAISAKNDIISTYSGFLTDHVLKDFNDESRTVAKNELSELVYTAYKTDEKFLIPGTLVEVHYQKYVTRQILFKDGSHFKFEHHLINELFIAYKISKSPEMWDRSTFDMITFENRLSFEIIQMILEQIPDEGMGEEFLMRLYDWNFYATLHCLGNVDKNYSKQIAIVIILLLTEKLFDRFLHTKLKVKEYLKPLYGKFDFKGIDISQLDEFVNGNPTIEANRADFEKIINSNSIYFKGGKYGEWYKIFTTQKQEVNEQLINRILDDNSLIGWSLSNVIKRFPYTMETEMQLRVMLIASTDDIKRWRIVHSLGNAATELSIGLLLKTIGENNYKWTTYGALRSYMEVVLFGIPESETPQWLEGLFYHLKNAEYDKIIINELISCLETETTKGKGAQLLKFANQAYREQHANFAEKQKWLQLQEKLNAKYGH